MIPYVHKLPFYFLCSFCWYFHNIVWWFYFNEISNCCAFVSLFEIFANLPVYYFGRNLPASPFIPPSPSIRNWRVVPVWESHKKAPNLFNMTRFRFLRNLFQLCFVTCLAPFRWNPPWRGERSYLTRRFQPVHQEEELVEVMLPRSSRKNIFFMSIPRT